MELTTTILKTVRRVERANPQKQWVATYYLCCDEAPTGTLLFYVKCYLESWNGLLLMEERLGTTDLPGCDRFRAAAFFNKITRVGSIVHPEHLADVVRDELAPRTPRGKRCRVVSLPIRGSKEPGTGQQGSN